MKKFILLVFFIILLRLLWLNLYKGEYYNDLYINRVYKVVYESNPRGRILDRNGKVLVDNIGVRNLYYRGKSNKDIASKLESIINVSSDVILSRMTNGYSYDDKLIKENISNYEYELLINMNIDNLYIKVDYKRYYPYNDVLRDIFGTVGYIPKDKKDEYIKSGYKLNDIVGISYLEYYYDDYLKGIDDVYVVNDGKKKLIKKGSVGKDLVLSIDIDLQIKVEEVIMSNISNAKNYKYTDYLKEGYVIVSDPSNFNILALSGKLYENGEFKNSNVDLLNKSFTVGSVVKPASLTVSYLNNVIDIGYKVKDSCVKIKNKPIKCSYKYLGYVDDIDAIGKSSNYYQFNLAMKVSGYDYKYNMEFNPTIEDFNKYRDVYNMYGLDGKTYIDLPNEKTGIRGNKIDGDLLLNLSIGQYDTYTPLNLISYVNTLAEDGNKKRLKIAKDDNNMTISKINLDKKYFERIRLGMISAHKSGTARGYINNKYLPAGKTGTSEGVINVNNKLINTISINYIGYAPYDNPKFSVAVVIPNIYEKKDYDYSKIYISRYIVKEISDYYFSN